MAVNLFNLIREQASIVDVIGYYMPLERIDGAYTGVYTGVCPCGYKKELAFTVNPVGSYYCFGCKDSGDAVAFVVKVEKCTPHQAANKLLKRYQIEAPNDLCIEFEKHEYFEEDDCHKHFECLEQWIYRWALTLLDETKDSIENPDKDSKKNKSKKLMQECTRKYIQGILLLLEPMREKFSDNSPQMGSLIKWAEKFVDEIN